VIGEAGANKGRGTGHVKHGKPPEFYITFLQCPYLKKPVFLQLPAAAGENVLFFRIGKKLPGNFPDAQSRPHNLDVTSCMQGSAFYHGNGGHCPRMGYAEISIISGEKRPAPFIFRDFVVINGFSFKKRQYAPGFGAQKALFYPPFEFII